jgi:hypothetical protein
MKKKLDTQVSARDTSLMLFIKAIEENRGTLHYAALS